MQKTQLKGAVMLLLTALIWGMAFTAQSKGMESMGAFTFNAIRMLMGGAVLLPCILIRDRAVSKKLTPQQKLQKKKEDATDQIVDNAERKTQGGVLTASDLLDDEAEKKDE